MSHHVRASESGSKPWRLFLDLRRVLGSGPVHSVQAGLLQLTAGAVLLSACPGCLPVRMGVIIMEIPINIVVVSVAVLAAAIIDVRQYRIHNALTFPLIVLGAVFHTILSGTAGLAGSVLGLFIGVGLLIVPFVMGGLGAGDVKLLAGVGAWVGFPLVLYVFIGAGLATGLYSLVMIVRQTGGFRAVWANIRLMCYRMSIVGRHLASEDWVETQVEENNKGRLVPFAAMVAIGLLGVILWTHFV